MAPLSNEDLVKELEILSDILDVAVLQKLISIRKSNRLEFLSKILNSFLNQSPRLIQALQEAVERFDVLSMADAAHSLKSSSGTIGAMKLFEFCQNLESLANAKQVDNPNETFLQIYEEFNKIKNTLINFLNQIEVHAK